MCRDLPEDVLYRIVGSAKLVVKLDDESIDCIITSPPYWGLRDYNVEGQWGLEPDFRDYLEKLRQLMNECKRILKKTGTCWINLGDTYSSISSYSDKGRVGFEKKIGQLKYDNIIKKSRFGIPERFYINCIDGGWIARNDIIWYKRNAMPSSVKDRFTNHHEMIYFFAKSQKYYFDLDAIRIPTKTVQKTFNVRVRDSGKQKYFQKASSKEQQQKQDGVIDPRTGRPKANYKGFNERWRKSLEVPGQSTQDIHRKRASYLTYPNGTLNNPKGKNPGDVWDITVKPFKDAHFATFPIDLPTRIIKCACPKDGIVFDPFLGAGTTALAAQKLGRKWAGIEINDEYIAIIKKRLGIIEDESSLLEKWF